MTALTQDVWGEVFLLGVLHEDDANEVQFAGMTEDITGLDFGEKDIEGIALLNGGRAVKKVPMTDETMTLKVIPVGIARDGTGAAGWNGSISGSDPWTVVNDNKHKRCRIVLVCAVNLPTAAGSAIASGECKRITVSNAYCTKANESFDDKYNSGEMVFKWAPFTKSAVTNVKKQAASNGLSAVTATATDVTA